MLQSGLAVNTRSLLTNSWSGVSPDSYKSACMHGSGLASPIPIVQKCRKISVDVSLGLSLKGCCDVVVMLGEEALKMPTMICSVRMRSSHCSGSFRNPISCGRQNTCKSMRLVANFQLDFWADSSACDW